MSEHPGRWYPGMPSPNPGGRQKAVARVVELAKLQTDAAIQTLTNIMVDEDASKHARVAAANALLDRAWGRPAQSVEVSLPEDLPQKDMSPIELARNIAFALQLGLRARDQRLAPAAESPILANASHIASGNGEQSIISTPTK